MIGHSIHKGTAMESTNKLLFAEYDNLKVKYSPIGDSKNYFRHTYDDHEFLVHGVAMTSQKGIVPIKSNESGEWVNSKREIIISELYPNSTFYNFISLIFDKHGDKDLSVRKPISIRDGKYYILFSVNNIEIVDESGNNINQESIMNKTIVFTPVFSIKVKFVWKLCILYFDLVKIIIHETTVSEKLGELLGHQNWHIELGSKVNPVKCISYNEMVSTARKYYEESKHTVITPNAQSNLSDESSLSAIEILGLIDTSFLIFGIGVLTAYVVHKLWSN